MHSWWWYTFLKFKAKFIYQMTQCRLIFEFDSLIFCICSHSISYQIHWLYWNIHSLPTTRSNRAFFMIRSVASSPTSIKWTNRVNVGKGISCTKCVLRSRWIYIFSSILKNLVIRIDWPAIVQYNKLSFRLITTIKIILVKG